MNATTIPPEAIHPEATLAELATHWAGASRVLQRFDLDYCCRGARTLADACRARGLALEPVLAELRAELAPARACDDWSTRPTAQLIAHLVDGYHAAHRAELPRLLAMAEKVERVHAGNTECPAGLAEHLHGMALRLEQHMQKEEHVLFPLLLGDVAGTEAPIACLRDEHDGHGADLQKLRALAHDFVPPASACNTWRALYLGLHELERMLMEHIHLENHVLFARGRG